MHLHRSFPLVLLPFLAPAAPAADSTMSFLDAEPLVKDALEHHAAARLFDWDADGDADLLVGGGDGRLWWFRNSEAKFVERNQITAGAQSEWGKTYTGVVLANLIGADPNLPDLFVAHSGDRISIHENTGKPGAPSFSGTVLQVTIQKNCQGRFDVADWDGDGLLDLVTGSFGGKLLWYRNAGTRKAPSFRDGESFHDISRAYNSPGR